MKRQITWCTVWDTICSHCYFQLLAVHVPLGPFATFTLFCFLPFHSTLLLQVHYLSMAKEINVSMKLPIDTRANRVLFAEASKDCIDLLFHMLSPNLDRNYVLKAGPDS